MCTYSQISACHSRSVQLQGSNRKKHKRTALVCKKNVKVFNKFMGSIDFFDSYIALYRTKTNSNSKFYEQIFFHMMKKWVVSSWLLYRRDRRYLGVPSEDHHLVGFQSGNCQKALQWPWNQTETVPQGFSWSFNKKQKGRTQHLPNESILTDSVDQLPLMSSKRPASKNPGFGSKDKTNSSNCSISQEKHLYPKKNFMNSTCFDLEFELCSNISRPQVFDCKAPRHF